MLYYIWAKHMKKGARRIKALEKSLRNTENRAEQKNERKRNGNIDMGVEYKIGTEQMKSRLEAVLAQYVFKGTLLSVETHGNGHINDTYLLKLDAEADESSGLAGKQEDSDELEESAMLLGKQKGTNELHESSRLILQRINSNVFRDPGKVMENIVGVTEWIYKKVQEQGGDPRREVLHILPTAEGKSYALDGKGDYWRMSLFIPDAVCYDMVDRPELFYEGAVAFGKFQQMLEDYPAETLHETIRGFHDTYGRFQTFLKAVEEDPAGRAASILEEIRFVKDREALARAYVEAEKREHIPLRVTHNDTKLNNVMLDARTGKGLCVIDLDTVMPGYVMNDFGDAIRSGTNTAAEDEPDTAKVSCSLELYEAFVKGFLEVSGASLTEWEKKLLPLGAKMMTYELTIRFLTDYLQGDTYFKTAYPEHNLVRTRNQMALLADMEKKWDGMQAIAAKYISRYLVQSIVEKYIP